MAEVLQALTAVVRNLMGKASKGKQMSEAEFVDSYSRIATSLDVFIINGIVASTELDTIEAYANMSADKKK